MVSVSSSFLWHYFFDERFCFAEWWSCQGLFSIACRLGSVTRVASAQICEIFLAAPNKDMTPAKRVVLANLMRAFLDLCQQAIVVNKVRLWYRIVGLRLTRRRVQAIITAKHQKFQQMVEKVCARRFVPRLLSPTLSTVQSFESMKKDIEHYISQVER